MRTHASSTLSTTLALVALLALAPGAAAASGSPAEANPPAAGFDLEGSDPEAVALADEVMAAMGGRQAWDDTRFLAWEFFGRRSHVWDKHTGDIRVEGTSDEGEAWVVLMNLHDKQGRVWQGGEEIVDPEALAERLDRAEAMWINDSYWLVMPYKLKDSGVTLRLLGDGTMADGRGARVLELTFRDVGRTPQNKYHVYVAAGSGLVEQWDYYAEAGDGEPRFSSPWHDWQRHGWILLSGNRGDSQITGIAVFDELPPSVLADPGPFER